MSVLLFKVLYSSWLYLWSSCEKEGDSITISNFILVESNHKREYYTNYVFITYTVSMSKLRTLLSTEVEFFWNESPPVKNKLNPQIHWINFKLETKFRKYNSSKARNMKSVRSFYDPAPTIFILLHFIDLDIDCLFGENTVHHCIYQLKTAERYKNVLF